MIDPEEARSFLTTGRVAVIGASDDKANFGRTVCQALRAHGSEVVAVHPEATSSGGAPAYRSLEAVPPPIDTAVVMVPAAVAADVVTDCITLGIRRIWLFQGLGRGSVSEEALNVCRDADVEVVAGACPLMFLEPVRGVHRMHRGIRRLRGAVAPEPAAAATPPGSGAGLGDGPHA